MLPMTLLVLIRNGFEVDNLFLDMNGIIHPCCHPTEGPVPPDETAMMKAIMDYLDRIVQMIRPRRLLYLAVDGVSSASQDESAEK